MKWIMQRVCQQRVDTSAGADPESIVPLSKRIDTVEFEFFQDNCVLIVDECHHVSSPQMLDVLDKLPGKFRFGFSGTPLKYDVLADMKLIGMTGDVVVDIPNEYLISRGFSATPLVHFYVIESNDEVLWKLDYQTAYKLCIVENDERNRIISKNGSPPPAIDKFLIPSSRISEKNRLYSFNERGFRE